MFGFGAPAMLDGAAFQGLDHILWNITDQKLGHLALPFAIA
jgi:hypothetical protein